MHFSNNIHCMQNMSCKHHITSRNVNRFAVQLIKHFHGCCSMTAVVTHHSFLDLFITYTGLVFFVFFFFKLKTELPINSTDKHSGKESDERSTEQDGKLSGLNFSSQLNVKTELGHD